MTYPHEMIIKDDYNSPVRAYFHGLCSPDVGGHACSGFHVPAHPAIISHEPIEGYRWVLTGPSATAMLASYNAILDCLTSLWEKGIHVPLVLCCDQGSVIDECNHHQVVVDDCTPLGVVKYRLAKAQRFFGKVTFELVTPAENVRAIHLANRALEWVTGKAPKPPRQRI